MMNRAVSMCRSRYVGPLCLGIAAIVALWGPGVGAEEDSSLDGLDSLLGEYADTAEVLSWHADQSPEPWQGRWIGPAVCRPNQWLCFRTSFDFEVSPLTTTVRIACDSKYWLWLNGTLVIREGQLKRGPTPNDTWFDEYDLAAYLNPGRNTVAILVWYFGKNGFSHNDSGRAGLLFDMQVHEQPTVISDRNWRMIEHPAYGKAGGPEPNFRLPEHSIRFDARLDLPGWTESDYDDSMWGHALEFGDAAAGPWNALFRRPLPQWLDTELTRQLQPPVRDGVCVLSLPFNQRFTPYLDVEGAAGRVVGIDTDSSGLGPSVRAEYVLRDGRQDFEFPGWLSGHELRLTVSEGVTIHAVGYRPHRYPALELGSFRCSDAFYTTLWDKAVRTLTINMADTWFDCPERERAQWWGDVVIDLGQTPYALDPRAELLTRKGFLDLARWQRPDKTLFSPVPAGNWDKELPTQMLAAVGHYGLLTWYRNTGDLAAVRQVYPAFRDYLLDVWHLSETGLVEHRSGGWDWSDWGENIDQALLDNAWVVLALTGLRECAQALGETRDVARFSERETRIRDAFNRTFWTGTEYRSPGYGGATDDRGHALAVLAGLTTPEQRDAILAVFSHQAHASPYMEKYVLEALFALGDPKAALARMKTRYTPMVDDASTTLWETFPKGGTRNHAWSGGPLTLLARNVVGLVPETPGFAEFSVFPSPGPLTAFRLVAPSAHGAILAAYQTDATGTELTLRVPTGTVCVAGLPASGAGDDEVTVTRTAPDAGSRATAVPVRAGYHGFRLPPGKWVLRRP